VISCGLKDMISILARSKVSFYRSHIQGGFSAQPVSYATGISDFSPGSRWMKLESEASSNVKECLKF
jgi:hypothetical protein